MISDGEEKCWCHGYAQRTRRWHNLIVEPYILYRMEEIKELYIIDMFRGHLDLIVPTNPYTNKWKMYFQAV
jgi:hypothetical protein